MRQNSEGDYVKVPEALLELGLDDATVMTYIVLRKSAWGGVGGEYRKGQQTLAQERGLSERQVRRHLEKLIAAGAIEERYAGRGRAPKIYTIGDPAFYDWAASTHKASDRTSVSGRTDVDRTPDRTSMSTRPDTDVRSLVNQSPESDQSDLLVNESSHSPMSNGNAREWGPSVDGQGRFNGIAVRPDLIQAPAASELLALVQELGDRMREHDADDRFTRNVVTDISKQAPTLDQGLLVLRSRLADLGAA